MYTHFLRQFYPEILNGDVENIISSSFLDESEYSCDLFYIDGELLAQKFAEDYSRWHASKSFYGVDNHYLPFNNIELSEEIIDEEPELESIDEEEYVNSLVSLFRARNWFHIGEWYLAERTYREAIYLGDKNLDEIFVLTALKDLALNYLIGEDYQQTLNTLKLIPPNVILPVNSSHWLFTLELMAHAYLEQWSEISRIKEERKNFRTLYDNIDARAEDIYKYLVTYKNTGPKLQKWKALWEKVSHILSEAPSVRSNDKSKPDFKQEEAVKYRGGNLLILAGAGSGKTKTLTERAISFLSDIPPERLMVVTFTKKAAKEILERVYAQVPSSLHQKLKLAWIGTIHSVCWRVLMENPSRANLLPGWSVLDMADSLQTIKNIASSFNVYGDTSKEIYQLYSYARNADLDWRELVGTMRFPSVKNEITTGKVIEVYKRRCTKSNRVDFDDLQCRAVEILEKNPEVREMYRQRFKAILVDEYQDTNVIQEKFLKLLHTNNITVVGDDAQSIYGFRAATVENILNFTARFNAHIITLGTNYRSSPEIVDLSNEIIAHNPRQLHKSISSNKKHGNKPILLYMSTMSQEAKEICHRISQFLSDGWEPEGIAVLFRATRQVAALQLALQEAGIPYKLTGGEDFFSLEHIKIVLDLLRLLINPDDSIALSAVQNLLRFSSQRTIEEMERKADEKQVSFWSSVDDTFTVNQNINDERFSSLREFGHVLKELSAFSTSSESVSMTLTKVIDSFSEDFEDKFRNNWEEVIADFNILTDIASNFSSLTDFLNTLSLEHFQEGQPSPDIHPISLSTVHSAKGLEWDIVFVIGLVDFWFPSQLTIKQTGTDEEERRLFYVAVTRAKTELSLSTYESSPNPYGTMMRQTVSRFINELPDRLVNRVHLFEDSDDFV